MIFLTFISIQHFLKIKMHFLKFNFITIGFLMWYNFLCKFLCSKLLAPTRLIVGEVSPGSTNFSLFMGPLYTFFPNKPLKKDFQNIQYVQNHILSRQLCNNYNSSSRIANSRSSRIANNFSRK